MQGNSGDKKTMRNEPLSSTVDGSDQAAITLMPSTKRIVNGGAKVRR
jgi:hypothetical protein